MEETRKPQEENIEIKNNLRDDKKQGHSKKKLSRKSKKWLIIGAIVIAIAAIAGIVIGILAANGIFNNDDDACPVGKHKVCGLLKNGEKKCACYTDRK